MLAFDIAVCHFLLAQKVTNLPAGRQESAPGMKQPPEKIGTGYSRPVFQLSFGTTVMKCSGALML